MGIAVLLVSCFLKSDWSGPMVTETNHAIQQSPFKSAPEKGEDIVECQAVGEYSGASEYLTLDEFTQTVTETGENDIFYRRGPDQINVTYRSSPEKGDLSMPVGFGGMNGWQFNVDEEGPDTVDMRIDSLRDVFVNIANVIDPDVASLMLFNDHGRGDAMPDSHDPSQHGLNALPFLLLLSDSWITYCGGREHVKNAPVYAVDELETGSILLQAKQRPSVDGCRYTQGFDYLFGGH